MIRALSTPPVIPSCLLADSPQPVPSAAQGLLLRPWEPADAPAFLSAYQDGEIRRWHTRRPLTETHVREWFDAYRQDWEREKGGHWAVARDDGEVLGRIALRGFNFDDGIAGAGGLRRRHRDPGGRAAGGDPRRPSMTRSSSAATTVTSPRSRRGRGGRAWRR
jgi:hypothetical protein